MNNIFLALKTIFIKSSRRNADSVKTSFWCSWNNHTTLSSLFLTVIHDGRGDAFPRKALSPGGFHIEVQPLYAAGLTRIFLIKQEISILYNLKFK